MHRLAWELAYGAFPTFSTDDAESQSYFVAHTCGNRRCVRPEHLQLVRPDTPEARRRAGASVTSGTDAAGVGIGSARSREALLPIGPERPVCPASLGSALISYLDCVERGMRQAERLSAQVDELRSNLAALRQKSRTLASGIEEIRARTGGPVDLNPV